MDMWPQADYQSSLYGGAGAYINFFAQPFDLTSDDRSQNTEQGDGGAGGRGSIHNITLPYTNVSTTETATWDSGDNNIMWGGTDASSGWEDVRRDWRQDIFEWFGRKSWNNQVNMEVSTAGFKGPVLRQRHYSWNLINRSGTDWEGRSIAQICRNFQASVYGRMSPSRTADNIVEPPPMWTTTVWMEKTEEEKKGPGIRGFKENKRSKAIPKNKDFKVGGKDHPVSAPGAWRWSMDPFTSVLLNVSISPTENTEGVMTMTQDGWPLSTSLKCSFLEIDQCVAMQNWGSIIPYSWASNTSHGNFPAGLGGNAYSEL